MSNLLEDIGQPPTKHKHILLIGGTGVGQTLIATTAARKFGVVYSVSNATPITSAGYIGDKVEHVLERLLNAANGDIEKAQNGVIILDEFDKKRTAPDGSGKDVSGKAVQQEQLTRLQQNFLNRKLVQETSKQNLTPSYARHCIAFSKVPLEAFVKLMRMAASKF